MISFMEKFKRRKDTKILNKESDHKVFIDKDSIKDMYIDHSIPPHEFVLVHLHFLSNFNSVEIIRLLSHSFHTEISYDEKTELYWYDIIISIANIRNLLDNFDIAITDEAVIRVFDFVKALSNMAIDPYTCSGTVHIDDEYISFKSNAKCIEGMNIDITTLASQTLAIMEQSLLDDIKNDSSIQINSNVRGYFYRYPMGSPTVLMAILDYKFFKEYFPEYDGNAVEMNNGEIYDFDELMEKFPGQWE